MPPRDSPRTKPHEGENSQFGEESPDGSGEWPYSLGGQKTPSHTPKLNAMSLLSCLNMLCPAHHWTAHGTCSELRGLGARGKHVCLHRAGGASVLPVQNVSLERDGTQESQPPAPGAGIIPLAGFQRYRWGRGWQITWLGPSGPNLRLCPGLKQNFWA